MNSSPSATSADLPQPHLSRTGESGWYCGMTISAPSAKAPAGSDFFACFSSFSMRPIQSASACTMFWPRCVGELGHVFGSPTLLPCAGM